MAAQSNQNAPSLNPVSRSPNPSSDDTYLVTIAVGFFMFNTVGAIVRIRQDIVAVTFTLSLFVLLMILFWCLSVFEKLPRGSKKKERLKLPIWVLSTTLNLLFAYRVWTIIIPNMALGWLVWGMAGTTCLITFYVFFIHDDKKIMRSEDSDSRALCEEQV